MWNEQRYQQEVLSALIKWTIVIGVPAGLLNLVGFFFDPIWTTPIGSGIIFLLSLIAWWCLRLARRGQLQRAARIYLLSGMFFMALVVFIAAKHEFLIGAMGLSVFVVMATFFDSPQAAMRWGMFSAILYEFALVARRLIPGLDLGLSIAIVSLYVVPPIVLIFFALVGRIIARNLRGALTQSERARRDLARSHAEVELRVEQRTRDLVLERNRLDAALRELALARDQAEAANRAKSAFLATMSHELRTPLTAILGYSELLQKESLYPGNGAFVHDVKAIWSAGQHLLALVDTILDLSKIEAGRLELFLETFDVAALVDDVAITVRPLVARRSNTLVVECADDLATMRADQTRLRQVLFNLLSNAAKFTDHGVITLAVAREEHDDAEWISFKVADTGIGIPPEYMPHLFEKFAQADASTTRRYGGAGLGLAISRRFCQLMGGDITVTSAPGQGALFCVRLPAEVGSPAAARAAGATLPVDIH